jgi:hypothetical protein
VLAGARPAAAVRRLGQLPGIEVHADVDDLGPYLAAATIAIAPMASGSGVPMKVLEAWAAGLPVVAHPWSAAGLPADARDALAVADGADEWHRTVTRLVTDPSAAAGLAERGRELWRRSYHPERGTKRAGLAAAIEGGDEAIATPGRLEGTLYALGLAVRNDRTIAHRSRGSTVRGGGGGTVRGTPGLPGGRGCVSRSTTWRCDGGTAS